MSRVTKTPLPKRGEDTHASDIAKRSRQEWVKVCDLTVDRRYQRGVTAKRVNRIAEHFDPDAFGTCTLSQRDDGTLVIIDGQHRTAALRQMGWEDQAVPCLVYVGLSLEEEARIFRLMNAEAAAPKAFDIFRARLTEEEPTAVEIDKIVRSVGLTLHNQQGKGHVLSISAVERIYANGGPQVLKHTLQVIKDAYGHLDDGHQCPYVADVLTAIGVILSRYGRTVDQARLSKVISRSAPQALLRDARATAQAISATSIGVNVLPLLLVQRYNTRIDSTKRLPQWEMKANKHVWAPLSVKVVAS